MLSFAEEIFLLALNDREGSIKPLPVSALEYALPGALLMELAFLNRIDIDLKRLQVVNPEPAGNVLLDDVLRQIEMKSEAQPTSYWLSFFAGQAKQIQEHVLAQLIAKGILKTEDKKILWVFKTRRYPMIDNREIKEITARLRDLILGDEIPDPREAVLVSLVDACRLFDDLFSAEEYDRLQPRIKALAKLDLIGQEITKSIREIAQAMALAMMP
ncbi:MAG: GPP34 family phosphoprotein [Kiritimatiellia bacterium]|nr:GPP34 family phosphoprotein [Kiritimatiellia bacterium]